MAGVRARQSMVNYNYLENQSLDDINVLGANDWQVIDISVYSSPQSFNVFVQKGRIGYELIEVDSETNFFISKDFSLFSGFLTILLAMAIFVIAGLAVYRFVFKND